MLHTGGWTTMTDQRILKRQKREREETKGVYKDTGKAEHRRIQRERHMRGRAGDKEHLKRQLHV